MFKYTCFAALLGSLCVQAAQVPIQTVGSDCKSRNGYFSLQDSCDSYIECRDFVATEMMCPDGMHYNPDAQWPEYPCGYPMDVPCRGRTVPQPAKATAECPHQYGFFKSPLAASNDCGQYRMCVEGRAIEMFCPPGLAFNPDTSRCDWPDLVAKCNAEDFLGFSCPPVENPALTYNYRYEGDCAGFFSCTEGRARLLMCDAGTLFDAASGHCIDADKAVCHQTIQTIAAVPY